MAEEKQEATEQSQDTNAESKSDGEGEVKSEDKGTQKLSNDADFTTDINPDAEDFEPLFKGEGEFTEAELTGLDEENQEQAAEKEPEEKETAKPEDEVKEKEPEEKKEDDTKKAEKKPEEKSKEEAEAEEKSSKPPDGYVPHAALYEEREKRKALSSEVQTLKEQIATIQAEKEVPPEPELVPDFEVLSDEALDELIEEDPQEAIRYQAKLGKFEAKKAKAERALQDQKREAETIVMSTVDRIEKAIPGIYDDKSTVATDLAKFALDSGFKDEAFLEIMTNPATVVIPAGTNKQFLLSNGAASLIEMLHNIQTKEPAKAEETDVEKIKSDMKAEMEKELTVKITKELLSKLKPEHVPSEYKSIEELPGSQESPVSSTKQYTEKEFMRLSEDEQAKLLGA